jgi:signal transduction histidine kinase
MHAMEATTDIAKAVGGETELERVLELIVKRGRALVHASVLTIALLDGDELAVRAAAGDFRPELVDARIPADESVASHVLRTRRPQRLSDIGSQLRFALAAHVDATAGLVVPLVFKGRPVGALYAFDRQHDGPEFSGDDELLLEAFAASAATAVATAQEFTAHGLQRSIEASERERRRWARELHDQTLQDLGGLRVMLSAARRSGDPERLAATVDAAVTQLSQGIDELRAIITDLRPAALDELGTKAALEALVARLLGMPDAPEIALSVELDGDGAQLRHTAAIENTLYRLVQEALTNAIKHGGARRIEVSVAERDGRIEALVTDDGAGFEPERTGSGFGLIGMRERLALVDGSLRITSEPGQGSRVRAVIPSVRREAGERLAEAG